MMSIMIANMMLIMYIVKRPHQHLWEVGNESE